MTLKDFTRSVFFSTLLIVLATVTIAAAEGQTVIITNDTDYQVALSLKMNLNMLHANPQDSESILTLPAKQTRTLHMGTWCPKRLDGEASYAVFKKQIYSRCVGFPYIEGLTISCPMDCSTVSTHWKIQLQGTDFHFVKQ